MKNTDCWAKFSDKKDLFLVFQVTQMKIKNNPFAKAFLGGNASERAHNGSYIPPLEMVARLHPTLLPPMPPLPAPPPPYSAPFPGPPPLQSFIPQDQGANYSLSSQQMTPPVMPSDHQFVYQDYNGLLVLTTIYNTR
jgi:hypothetical protein